MAVVTIEKAKPGMGDEVLSKLLFQTPGVRVLAVGPPGCLRILYFRAMEAEALSRLRLCPVSKLGYTLGNYHQKVRDMLEDSITTRGTKGVVLYVSCPDLLTQTDFETLITEAKKPFNVPVAVFKRGPMEKRKKKPVERLEEIVKDFDRVRENRESGKDESLCPLPPLAADYSGALAAFQTDKTLCTCLVTGSGCASCPKSIDHFSEDSFWHTRMNDLQVALGEASDIEKNIKSVMRAEEKQRAFMTGTPLTAMTGIDSSDFPNMNAEIFVQTDGFHDALEGTRQALSAVSKQWIPRRGLTEKQINLIGYTPFIFGNKEQFEGLVRDLKRLGYAAAWLGGGDLEDLSRAPRAKVSWVISETGLELAEWLKKQYGIPWFYQMPVSISGLGAAYQQLERLTGDAAFQDCMGKTACLKQPVKNAVLFGSHELNRQMAVVLQDEFNVACTLCEMPDPACISGQRADYMVADPLYFQYLPENAAKKVPLPFPALSGNWYLKQDSCIVGQMGHAYLKQFFM